MKSSAKKVELASVDDLFTTEQERQEADEERVVRIPLTQLHYFKGYPAMQTEVPFTGQPYRFKDDDPKMQETLDSVKKRGVRAPGLVRPDPDGGYEIISGHRRHRASELAGLEDMPVIIRDMTDEEAVIEMVDANIQREKVMPSEKAWAYRMKLEAIKHQGARTDLTSVQVEQKLSARDKVAKDTVMSNHHLRNGKLSLKAKGLLSMMLSLPEDWNYTTRGLAKICKEGVDAIGGALRELETAGYIVRHQLRDRQGRISDTEYVIYEQPQPKNPDTPQPDTASPDTENPDMEKPDTEKPAELNIEKSNTQKIITDGSSIDSIPFREKTAARLPERKGRDAMSVSEIENYRDLILENIEYDYLCREFATYREDLDEIVELMVETVCARRKTTRIAGSDFPHEVVRSRFLKLDSEHIRFVMDSLQKNTTEVRNMKQYLLTVLFNAPTTISNHYTSQVNHDMNAGGW